jgi:hypothetical protein
MSHSINHFTQPFHFIFRLIAELIQTAMRTNIHLTLLIIIASVYSQSVFAQDTIYKIDREKISCKVVEIGTSEVKYRDWNKKDSPLFAIFKEDVEKVVFSDGTVFYNKPAEDLANIPARIIERSQCIKIGIFGPLNNQINIGYERVLRKRMNLEGKIGYIGLGINSGSYYNQSDLSGVFFKTGFKYLLNPDYYVRGSRFTHPLKGKYLKIEFALSHFRENHINGYIYTNSGSQSVTYSVNHTAGAILLCFGNQHTIGNHFTLDWGFGLGYGVSSDYASNNQISRDYDYTINYYSHGYGSSIFPFTVTSTFAIGYSF